MSTDPVKARRSRKGPDKKLRIQGYGFVLAF